MGTKDDPNYGRTFSARGDEAPVEAGIGERLLKQASTVEKLYSMQAGGVPVKTTSTGLMREAATLIESQSAEIARQRELIEDAVPILEVLVADRETLIGEECEIARDLQARFLTALDPQPTQGEG